MPHVPSALGAYERSIKGLLGGSDRVAGVVQSGSLPVYLMVLLGTLVVVPGVPLVLNGGPETWPAFVDSPLQLVIGTIMIVGRPGCGGDPEAVRRRACSSARSATAWPRCSSCRARPTWPSPSC